MDIADNSGTDLHLEILRRECDKENEAPRQESSGKTAEKTPATKELVSFTETSSKTSEEKEGLRIQSVSVVPEPKSFDSFTSSKLEECAPANGPKQEALEPFPPFRDLQQAPDRSTSSRQEVVSGDEKNFTKTVTETRHEVKGPTELSFMRTEQESRSVDSPHSLPDITMDTIDLNNLISETQKRLDSFRNNFGGNGTLDATLGSLGRKEVVNSSTFSSSLLSEMKEKMASVEAAPQSIAQPPLQQKEEKSEVVVKSEAPQEVSNKTEPAKKIPPPTLPKPKLQPSLGDAFKDCLREMETDPAFSLPDIGFTSQSSETSTTTTDIPFGTETVIKKKKMFSSSSFYEEPNSIYPTMEEQVEMARKIADSLADDTNKKSKGANMFYKRVKKSTKWIHEGPEPSDESGPATPEVEPPTPDFSQVPFRPSKGPPSLKLVLDPRHPLDLTALRSSGYVISEHNVVSPEVCHGLVKDLQSPMGKGAALFAKRKKKSEEWVVDEEKVKTLLREQKERHFHVPPLSTSPAYNQYSAPLRQDVKLVKSPWEAAMESPFGLCDAAFARVHPDQLADTVMKRADYIRSESLSRESSRMEGCVSPPQITSAPPLHDIYHAKAPRGWEGNFPPINYSPSVPPVVSSPSVPHQQPRNVQNGFQPSTKMVFQNFNAVPRLWKGASVH